ncbi:deleted in malignant brain tumors 1 protein-like [Echeneis naucrates]|uniref:deleted in malignant brain tumors 1 protein-like n=1 Tax=Echeneis naucrates TaxID=173247 RepID=UPI001113776E|nr:deleted in malignant brain tumors 1 protein-like [Echeneis naucrates]XP_029365022.1 deleted in malignant brain tumors 1 protein-like [Echeneis naucrates]XP_029365023.1 deleted in malignant brain tumors 1 protein-like [Echeneis naucrates]XP_029365024.1 deleted in malignant brain tumors 1 protein-like [Echeneis naucrates]XP_029365025.1 deleted in malignant brain tumors 1 protein-like [Echeneis naucrates]XP_029365027.1 deleted in malignant brain tumors 1 protein-like [Echeneis naucrates]XP_02
METRKRSLHPLTLVSFLLVSVSPAGGAQIRLVGSGSTQCSGRVEIYLRGAWGTVCDDGWDLPDATVVCRQLNCGTAWRAMQSAHFGQGSGNIWLDDLTCSGHESSLTECGHGGVGVQNCNHGEDAGVICSGSLIRLAGSGSTLCSGRVEVYHSGAWGTVCDDSWDLNDAKVVCRQLECGEALGATGNAAFGEGTGEIFLDDLACSGNEGSFNECQHNGFKKHNCQHSEDAGVICSMSLPTPTLSIDPAGEVTWGQEVTITCSSSPELVGGQFILISDSNRRIKASSSNPAVFSISNVNFDNEGSYQCQYGKNISGETFSSGISDAVRLSVTVSLPKPSISMNPADEVSWGQDVTFTCSVSTQHLGGTFTLQQTSGSLRKTQTSSSNSATFRILQVNFDNEGSYRCQYETRLSSRDFSSPLSDSVRLSVTVSLPKPSISMNPADEVSWGQDVTFTCSVSTQHLGGTFTLQQTSGSLRKTQTSSSNSATFRILQVNFDNEGSYRCQYEITLSSRDFSSPLSDSVRLSVTVPVLLLASSVFAAILLLLLLLVLLVACLVCRRRRNRNPPVLIFSRGAENDYDTKLDDDSENVKELFPEKKGEVPENNSGSNEDDD